jgi:hypothetical protein
MHKVMGEKLRKKPQWKKPREEWVKYERRGNGALKTEEEIANALGEEPRTIRTWRHNGIIPVIVLGHKTRRYRLESVLAALQKREVRPV